MNKPLIGRYIKYQDNQYSTYSEFLRETREAATKVYNFITIPPLTGVDAAINQSIEESASYQMLQGETEKSNTQTVRPSSRFLRVETLKVQGTHQTGQ